MSLSRNRSLERIGVVIVLAAGLLSVGLGAQDRLRSMPGYARYEKMSREIPSALNPARWRSRGATRRHVRVCARRQAISLSTC